MIFSISTASHPSPAALPKCPRGQRRRFRWTISYTQRPKLRYWTQRLRGDVGGTISTASRSLLQELAVGGRRVAL